MNRDTTDGVYVDVFESHGKLEVGVPIDPEEERHSQIMGALWRIATALEEIAARLEKR